jgi:ketosteroid isomerase-like protein
MTDHAALRDWLDRYEAAWRGNDPDAIRALFTDDASYRWHPWETGEDVTRGADAIAAAWLSEPDQPGSWQLRYEPLAVDGDLGVARCVTVYHPTPEAPGRQYHNLFLIYLTADGRCRDFTEYYMREPTAR